MMKYNLLIGGEADLRVMMGTSGGGFSLRVEALRPLNIYY